MKIGICGDVHVSKHSSIVRGRGSKYSQRLENIIESINWFEDICEKQNCDIVVYLGDFFDSATLDAESITALQDILWCNKPHYFLVGNHEIARNDSIFSSAHMFKINHNLHVIDSVKYLNLESDVNILFLPYILESNRLPLVDYIDITGYNKGKDTIILSHNDIAGIQMGPYMSKEGFSKDEILNNCKLFINGHLHNYSTENNIINIGNLTGQNFSEDGFKYPHQVMILDTSKRYFDYVENPYALYFYKIDVTSSNDVVSDMNNYIANFNNRCVLTVKTNLENEEFVRNIINNESKIIDSRVLIDINSKSNTGENSNFDSISIDHLKKFVEYVESNISSDELVREELSIIVGDTK